TVVLYRNVISLPHASETIFIKSLKIPKFLLKNKKKFSSITVIFGFLNLVYRIINTKNKIKKEDLCVAFDDYFGLVAVFSCKKVIVSVHNSPSKLYNGNLTHLLPDWVYKKILIKHLYKKDRVKKIAVVSEGIKKELIEVFGIPENKIEVIYNFFDKDSIQKKANEKIDINFPYIVNVGHLNKQKNQETLIDIFYELKKKYSIKEKLVIIGDGIFKGKLLKKIKSYNLSKEVYLLGKKENPYPYIKNARVYVSTSLFEGFPTVLVESAILQVPICALDAPHGISEITLNPAVDKQSLVKDILSVLKNKKYMQEKIDFQNKILALKFDNNLNKKKWIKIINENL
ncbi:glycosyltransferase, partial [Hydrogenivirga sp. 128-5-R1-1]|uniref:glycosyltransferase n=1 Tax=Hydrogenivirga sp. 128-5-R1-1 TaxID=392423 RepID=UPI00015EF331